MIRVFYIVLFMLFGSIFVPSKAIACTKSCISQKVVKKVSKECCEKKGSADKQNGCSGKCKNSNCQTVSFGFCAVLQNEVYLKSSFSSFFYIDNTNLLQQIGTSTGFYFIWSPPNIT